MAQSLNITEVIRCFLRVSPKALPLPAGLRVSHSKSRFHKVTHDSCTRRPEYVTPLQGKEAIHRHPPSFGSFLMGSLKIPNFTWLWLIDC